MTQAVVPAVSGGKVIKFTADGSNEGSTTVDLSPTGDVTLVDNLPNLPAGSGSGGAGVGVFGSAPQWSDADDATYARIQSITLSGADYATTPIATVDVDDPLKILSVSCSIRVSSPTNVNSKVNIRIMPSDVLEGESDFLVGDNDRLLTPTLPAADAPVTLTFALDNSDDIREVLMQSPLAVYVWPSSGGTDLKVYEFTLTVEIEGDTAPTEFTLLGPSDPSQGDSEKHRGKFAIDQNTRDVSARLKVGTTDADIWVKPVVQFFSADAGGDPTIGMGESSFTTLAVPAAPEWREINIFGSAPLGATHYSIVLRMFSDAEQTTPLAVDTEVYFDAIFVPESGYDLRDNTQPFLDGDQSFGIWEGEEENSTSIYGTKPPDNLSQMVILDDDLPVYDAETPDTPPTPPEE